MLSLVENGRFCDSSSWHEVKVHLYKKEAFFKRLRNFESNLRLVKFKDSQVRTLRGQYLASSEIDMALKSSSRHFAADLIDFLQ